MVYVCKVYANGNPEDTREFDTLAQAENWACKHARVVPVIGTGWDTRYTVSIYGDVAPGTDVTRMYPLKIVLE